jgi:hypothetical protein
VPKSLVVNAGKVLTHRHLLAEAGVGYRLQAPRDRRLTVGPRAARARWSDPARSLWRATFPKIVRMRCALTPSLAINSRINGSSTSWASVSSTRRSFRPAGRLSGSDGMSMRDLSDRVEMLQHDVQYRLRIRIGAPQKLVLDLVRQLLAEKEPRCRRQVAAVVVERLDDLLHSCLPRVAHRSPHWQLTNAQVIASKEFSCRGHAPAHRS